MFDVLMLRLQGPFMSFGGPLVDQQGVVQEYPALSMLTGLLGNALGYAHKDSDRLTALQERLRYGVRCDQPGRVVTDFQTVDLGQDFMKATGWTSRGKREDRLGGTAKTGTHIRYRQYIADAVYTIAIALEPSDLAPDLDGLQAALREPERPLFLGRKCCPPSVPLLIGSASAETFRSALEDHPRWTGPHSENASQQPLRAWWPADSDEEEPQTRVIPVTDERDWTNQIIAGRRLVREGLVNPLEAPNDH